MYPSILVMQTTENGFSDPHEMLGRPIRVVAKSCQGLHRVRNARAESSMRPASIVVPNPLTKDSSQMQNIQRDDIVEAFATYGSDEPFAMSIGRRHSNR